MPEPQSWSQIKIASLVGLHIILVCVSLVQVATYTYPIAFLPETFHLFFDPSRWWPAAIAVAAFGTVSILFVLKDFTFGYFVGFYIYTMIIGYLWLNNFTDLTYNYRLAGWSAATSAIAFLLPSLLVSSPIRQVYSMPAQSFERFLNVILFLGVAAIAIGAFYSFHLVPLSEIYQYRAKFNNPRVVNYLMTIISNAVLPFAFACFVTKKAYWRAIATLFLLILFYPITLTKSSLFAPFWLIALLALSRLFEARVVVILSLLAPALAGIVLLFVFGEKGAFYFATVNFRMLAIPSLAMSIYNDFFFDHALTYFCQISILKQIVQCPYQDQLSVVMEHSYGLGAYNASLLATEGIASVGVLLAPVSVFVCGLVVALANRLSAALPAEFILLSGGVLPFVFLNVPLTTILLTHGAAVLFLLWYISPRDFFEKTAA
jgi:hypothetical protein